MEYRHTSHFLHLIMTFLTGGFWIIPWVIFHVSNVRHNQQLDMFHAQNCNYKNY
ncbi:hypothetical protein PMW_163 [Pseudomonas phage phiPMW]|uniref:Uncharacterized protein n=1 Tax=Pseudomonas phage phiPMW TaxID=1815582 RepID=A0A1S5R1N9_9CAUD|nr:hypothetical protein FDG97_gp187 [Pseudomonas phage phiPMW]ANA49288.1 hypothetical protein PMW_163 [Pseudomonas phage phiPMW]